MLTVCRQNLAASDISPHVTDNEVLQSADTLERFKLIAGHFSILAQTRLSKDRFSFTFIRDPIRTIVSTYTFWRMIPELTELTRIAKRLSFPDFVSYFRDAPAIINNRFTYHFAALGRDSPLPLGDGSAVLAAAKRNLVAFDFVGISEEFERATRLLCSQVGWQLPLLIPHENRSPSEEEFLKVGRGTLQLLKDRNRLDQELHAFALELFSNRYRRVFGSTDGHAPCGFPLFSKPLVNGSLPTRERNSFILFPPPRSSDRRAIIENVTATWLAGKSSGQIELNVAFRTRVTFPDLVVGVAVYGPDGRRLWGTNTSLEQLPVHVEKQADCQVIFVLQFVAPPGRYSVTAALLDFSRVGTHEHWWDAAVFFDNPQSPAHSAEVSVKLLGLRSGHSSTSGLKPADRLSPRTATAC